MILLPPSMKLIFSMPVYMLIAIAVAISFWILFNFFDKLIFFEPVWIFYLPEDAIAGFVLTTIISVLMGILVSMKCIYYKTFKTKD
jgi:hypothetical protein